MVPVRLFVAAILSAHAFAPPRPHATLRRVARPAVIAGPPERWSWSGPVVPPAPTTLAETKGAQKRLVFLLAFNAGLADLVLVRTYGCYATMVTGTTVEGVAAAAGARWADAAFFGGAIASYLSGVGAFRILDERFGRGRKANRVLAPAVLLLFVGADAFGPARLGVLWCAAGFGLVNALSLDVLLTNTQLLTVHLHKLANLAVDFAGLAGREARARAKLSDVNKRSLAVVGAFGLGVAAGVGLCAALPGFVARGFQAALGASYALILLSHDRGALRSPR